MLTEKVNRMHEGKIKFGWGVKIKGTKAQEENERARRK